MKLFYYSNMAGKAGWFKNPAEYRAQFPGESLVLRCAHVGITPPAGWHKPNGELASDPIEKIPTMKDFIRALTP